MDDLLQPQIQDSCRLALPNGLKELMNDISREVLRAQPPNLLNFITSYLSTLLLTRENLYIAARVCTDVCACDCRPELEDELRFAGLDESVVGETAEIIEKYIRTSKVNEGNLLMKLISETSIDESHLPAVLMAVRKAFIRHQKIQTQIYETSSSSGEDESEKAVRRTLKLYREVEPTPLIFNTMAQKIQAAYRAFRVRRETGTEVTIKDNQLSKTPSTRSSDQDVRSTHQVVRRSTEVSEKAKVTFGSIKHAKTNASERSLDSGDEGSADLKAGAASSKIPLRSVTRLSSTSLAGSYLTLPQYKPYSAHEFGDVMELEETPEKERANIDYTQEHTIDENIRLYDVAEEHGEKSKMFESTDIDLDEEAEEADVEEEMVKEINEDITLNTEYEVKENTADDNTEKDTVEDINDNSLSAPPVSPISALDDNIGKLAM